MGFQIFFNHLDHGIDLILISEVKSKEDSHHDRLRFRALMRVIATRIFAGHNRWAELTFAVIVMPIYLGMIKKGEEFMLMPARTFD